MKKYKEDLDKIDTTTGRGRKRKNKVINEKIAEFKQGFGDDEVDPVKKLMMEGNSLAGVTDTELKKFI